MPNHPAVGRCLISTPIWLSCSILQESWSPSPAFLDHHPQAVVQCTWLEGMPLPTAPTPALNANYEPSEQFTELYVVPHFTTTSTGCQELLDKQFMVFILLFSTSISAWCPLSEPGYCIKST